MNGKAVSHLSAVFLLLLLSHQDRIYAHPATDGLQTLTQDERNRIDEALLDEVPQSTDIRQINAIFGDSIELVGWSVRPAEVVVGQELTVTWYWRVLNEMDERWEIFVHCDTSRRLHLDHEAIDGLFPTPYWETGQIIEDVQTVHFGSFMGTGEVSVYVGFWRRSDDSRMSVSQPGAGELGEDGRLLIGTFESQPMIALG